MRMSAREMARGDDEKDEQSGMLHVANRNRRLTLEPNMTNVMVTVYFQKYTELCKKATVLSESAMC